MPWRCLGRTTQSETRPSVFADTKGHADEVLRDLATPVWLGVIYDLSTDHYRAPEGYEVDLVGLAQQIGGGEPMVFRAWKVLRRQGPHQHLLFARAQLDMDSLPNRTALPSKGTGPLGGGTWVRRGTWAALELAG